MRLALILRQEARPLAKLTEEASVASMRAALRLCEEGNPTVLLVGEAISTSGASVRAASVELSGITSFVLRLTHTFDDHSLDRRLSYNANIGRPSFERQKEANREYVVVATHEIYNEYIIST